MHTTLVLLDVHSSRGNKIRGCVEILLCPVKDSTTYVREENLPYLGFVTAETKGESNYRPKNNQEAAVMQ